MAPKVVMILVAPCYGLDYLDYSQRYLTLAYEPASVQLPLEVPSAVQMVQLVPEELQVVLVAVVSVDLECRSVSRNRQTVLESKVS